MDLEDKLCRDPLGTESLGNQSIHKEKREFSFLITLKFPSTIEKQPLLKIIDFLLAISKI